MPTKQKPIHTEPKPDNLSEQEHAALINVATQLAQDKLNELLPHFGDNVSLELNTEIDDKEIRFYIGVRVEF